MQAAAEIIRKLTHRSPGGALAGSAKSARPDSGPADDSRDTPSPEEEKEGAEGTLEGNAEEIARHQPVTAAEAVYYAADLF